MAKRAKKRAAARAPTPVMVVAKAMNLDPQTLRYRLAYYGQRVKGASIARIVAVLKERSRKKLPPKVLRLLESDSHPPPIRLNPHPPPDTDTDQDAGYMALDEAKALAEANVGSGSYGRLEVCVIFAALELQHRKKR